MFIMGFVNVTRIWTLMIPILLFLLHVSESYPRFHLIEVGVKNGPEGSTQSQTIEIRNLGDMKPGRVYDGITPDYIGEARVNFKVGIGYPDMQFQLRLELLGNDDKPNPTLPDTTLDSLKLTTSPQVGSGKTVVFSNLQFSKTNKIETLNLLSKHETIPYLVDDIMLLTIETFHRKPEEKGSGKENEDGKKTPVWKILVPIFVVLTVLAIALVFLVRRKRIHGSYC